MKRILHSTKRLRASLLAVPTALLAIATTLPAQQPVKIFILAGQSNMLGKGTVAGVTTPGTLDYIVANDPDGKYQFLKSGGSYVVRNDVWIRDQDPVWGGLTTGFGGESSGLIGPELGFGHRMGDANETKILLVKCAWGGKSLAVDFRPPSSGWNVNPPVAAGDQGFYYTEILRLVNEATTNLASYVPGYNGEGYEFAGMGWHQGYNDRISAGNSDQYEANMVNFINDIRSALAAPAMPFVIATTGMDGFIYSKVEKAQMKMADASAYPAFAGNVAVIDTRSTDGDLDFWQPASASPANEGYHWNRNGKTQLHIGLAMGDAMSQLVPGRCPYLPRASGSPAGVTLTWKNGLDTPTSVRVLRNGVEIAAAAPVSPPSFLDAAAPLGTNDYELQFTMPENPCNPLTVKHKGGISRLNAKQRNSGIHLSWTNNFGYTAIQVKRNGAVIAAALPGNITAYIDSSPTAGLATYTIEPTDSGSAPAEVQIPVSAAPKGTAVIYEPFEMVAGTPLASQPGGIGLEGEWYAGSSVQVASGSYSFGTLPTFGNRIVRTSANGSCSINMGTTLADAGLLADGADLWFSFLHLSSPNSNIQPVFAFGNEILDSGTSINSGGSAIGAKIGANSKPQAMIFNAGTQSLSANQTTLGTDETALIVCHITWGATAGAADTIRIHTPGTDLVLDTPQSISAVLDQSDFQVLSMWGNGSTPNIDEIRFGATYDDVIGQGIDTSGDNTPPTPATMGWASAPEAISPAAITMTATTASDENGFQYRFHNTTLDTYSDWQDSPVYTDTGLLPNTTYAYTVQAQDKSVNRNTNAASSPAASATTDPEDTIKPNPNPMTWGTAPQALSTTEITMTASTATDASGVQYFFDCLTPGGHDSGWQDSPIYTDSGLAPSTTYTYEVSARDKSPAANETDPSAPATATTSTVPLVSLLSTYVNGTAADAAAFAQLTTTTGYSASSLSSVGLSTGSSITMGNYGGNSLPAGPTAGSPSGSEWLAVTASLAGSATPVSTDNYYGFTVTGTGGNTIDPSSLTFDGVCATADNATGGITAYYQIFAAADGGSFASVGSVGSIVGPTTSNTMGALATVAIDLTSLAAAGSYEFRIALGSNSTSPRKSIFLQGIKLNGAVVPAGGNPYDIWSGGASFDADANGDGVKDGLAWLLGAATPATNALSLLPAISQSGGDLVLTFSCLNAASRGAAVLKTQHSNNLGVVDPWTSNEAVVPETTSVVNGVSFVVTPGSPKNSVVATIPATEAAGGKLFGRLHGTGN